MMYCNALLIRKNRLLSRRTAVKVVELAETPKVAKQGHSRNQFHSKGDQPNWRISRAIGLAPLDQKSHDQLLLLAHHRTNIKAPNPSPTRTARESSA